MRRTCGLGAYQQLDGFGGGNGGCQVYGGVEDSGGFAGLEGTARWIGKKTCQAGGFPRQHVHRDAIAAHGSGVDPGEGSLHRKVIDEVAGLEVVGAVEDQVASPPAGLECWRERDRLTCGSITIWELKAAILRAAAIALGSDFGGIGFIEQGLALQIAGLDVVAIDDAQVPTPARASREARAEPVAPHPTRATRAPASRSCPSRPIPGKSTCREYLSSSSKEVTSSQACKPLL